MSTKGRPHTWLLASIEKRDLPGIRAAASELRWINLQDALAILPVLVEKDPELFDRAACRWLGRLALEREVTLEEIGVALAALNRLGNGSVSARTVLAGLVTA